MKNSSTIILPTNVLFACFFIGLLLAMGFVISSSSTKEVLMGIGLILIFILGFLKVEIALYLLILSMLLSPEFGIGGAGSGESLESSRSIVIRAEDLLLMIIGLSWLARTAIFKDLGLFLKTPLNRPIMIYLSAALLATLYGALQGRLGLLTGFFYVLKYGEYFIVYFMVVNFLQDEDQLKRFLFVTFLTCGIICLYGLYQIPLGGRVSAPFEGEVGEPNTLGGYLVFMLALTFGMFLNEPDHRKKAGWAGLSALIVIPLLFTLSRSSWMAAIPMFGTIALFTRKKGTIIVLTLAGMLIAPFILPQSVKERISYTFNQRYHQEQVQVGNMRLDTSTSARMDSWKEGIRDWMKHPILGFGVTGYKFVDAQYVKTLVETGIVGLAALLWLIFSIFRAAFQVFRSVEIPLYRGIVMGYIAGTVGLVVHAIGANTFIIIRIMEPFWLVTAMIMVMTSLESRSLPIDSRRGVERRSTDRPWKAG